MAAFHFGDPVFAVGDPVAVGIPVAAVGDPVAAPEAQAVGIPVAVVGDPVPQALNHWLYLISRILGASRVWDQDWGLPRVKRGTGGCNPTILAAEGGIGYIVKRAKRAQRRESWGQAVMRTCKLS